MLLKLQALLLEPGETLLMIFAQLVSKLAILNAIENIAHALPHVIIDQFGSCLISSKLRGVADRKHHVSQSALINQVCDLFYFMAAFQIRKFRRISSLHQS